MERLPIPVSGLDCIVHGVPKSQTGLSNFHFTELGWLSILLCVSLVIQMVKNWAAMRETWVHSLGWEDPLKDTWQPTPVFLPGEFPWSEKPGRLQSMGSQRVRHD